MKESSINTSQQREFKKVGPQKSYELLNFCKKVAIS